MNIDLNELAGMIGQVERETKLTPITVDDIEGGFEPIPDLKPGDRLRKKKNTKLSETSIPLPDQVVTVYRIIDLYGGGIGKNQRHADFTALFDDGTEQSSIYEYPFDSRGYERVID